MLNTDIGENRERDLKERQKGPAEKLAAEFLHVEGKKVPQARARAPEEKTQGVSGSIFRAGNLSGRIA